MTVAAGRERVRERLRLFWAVFLDTENYEDAMWAVLERDRQEQRRSHDLDPFARAILAATCVAMEVTRPGLVGRRREKELVHARWVAMRVLRDAGYTLKSIGRHLRRSHATVLQSLTAMSRRPELVATAERIRTSPKVQAQRVAA
jgi:chromosomal replication initiation ATPase DnaA